MTVADIAQLFDQALARHNAGDLPAAESLYREILSREGRHAPSLHYLGVIALQTRHFAQAAQLIESSLALAPHLADARGHLGQALALTGEDQRACLALAGALAQNPSGAAQWRFLGDALGRQELILAAARASNRCCRLDPADAIGWCNFGTKLLALGRLRESLDAFDTARKLQPNLTEAQANACLAQVNLGQMILAQATGKLAVAIGPDFAPAHANLAVALHLGFRLTASLTACERALKLSPNAVPVLINQGNTLKDLNRYDEALASYRAVLDQHPGHIEALSCLLNTLHLMKGVEPHHIHQQARHHMAQLPRSSVPPPSRRLKHGPLRIGLVSPDLRRHPVSYFLAPLMENYDRAALSITCYSASPHEDEVTARLRALSTSWRSLVGLKDADAARLVREDDIDILIDLAGHTAQCRLGLFALKPAPVQVTWLGYWGTTGLDTIDYLIADPWMIPPGGEVDYEERIIRLDCGRFCYAPPDYAPEPGPSPSLINGFVTFGSFNNLAKLGPDAIALWCALLKEVPKSRLLLKWPSLDESNRRSMIEAQVVRHGIDPQRLTLRGHSPHAAMLAEYADIDIALDPFPFSGGLTTCEALWMGVPVMTWPGRLASSRQGLGFLSALGLEKLVANSRREFFDIARSLAENPDALSALRGQMRQRMAASPLCDGAGFARAFEALMLKL